MLPEIAIADLSKLKLEKLSPPIVDDAAIEKALGELADRSMSYTAARGRPARGR